MSLHIYIIHFTYISMRVSVLYTHTNTHTHIYIYIYIYVYIWGSLNGELGVYLKG